MTLVDNELLVPEEGFRALPEPEADDAEVVCKILDVLGFYKIRVPLLGQQYKNPITRLSVHIKANRNQSTILDYQFILYINSENTI